MFREVLTQIKEANGKMNVSSEAAKIESSIVQQKEIKDLVNEEQFEERKDYFANSEKTYFAELSGDLPKLYKFTFDEKNKLKAEFEKLNKNATEVDKMCDNIETAVKIANLLDNAYEASTKIPGDSFPETLIDSIYTMYNFLYALMHRTMFEIGRRVRFHDDHLSNINAKKIMAGGAKVRYLEERTNQFDQISEGESATPNEEDDEAADEDTEDSETETDEKN